MPRTDRGVGRGPRSARTTAPAPRLSTQGSAPNSIPHPRPAGPLPALNTPTWAPIQLSSGTAASPRYCAFYGAPHGQNLHPLWYRQNPHYSSTYRPPANNPGSPSCGAIRHPHYGVSFSDPGPNPDPSKRQTSPPFYRSKLRPPENPALSPVALPTEPPVTALHRPPPRPNPSPPSGSASPPIITPDPATSANN